MNEQITEILELTKSMEGQVQERIKGLVEQIQSVQSESVQKSQFEELQKQMSDLQEQQKINQLKGNFNMSTEVMKGAEFDLNAAVKKSITNVMATSGDAIVNMEQVQKANGMSTTDAQSAAPLVRATYEQAIVRPAFERSKLLQAFNRISVKNTSHVVTISTGDYDTAWGKEAVANTYSPSNTGVGGFVQVTGVYGKLIANPYVTNELIHDADYDVMAEIKNGVADKISRVLPLAILSGDGVDKPKGLLTYRDAVEGLKEDHVRSHAVVQEIQIAVADRTKADKVFATYQGAIDTLNEVYAGNGEIWMHPSEWSFLKALANAQGDSYLRERMNIAGEKMLLGMPVVTDYAMPKPAKAGDVCAMIGDLKAAFTIAEVEGMSFLPNPFRVPGNVELYHSMRFGSIIGNLCAVKFVTLK